MILKEKLRWTDHVAVLWWMFGWERFARNYPGGRWEVGENLDERGERLLKKLAVHGPSLARSCALYSARANYDLISLCFGENPTVCRVIQRVMELVKEESTARQILHWEIRQAPIVRLVIGFTLQGASEGASSVRFTPDHKDGQILVYFIINGTSEQVAKVPVALTKDVLGTLAGVAHIGFEKVRSMVEFSIEVLEEKGITNAPLSSVEMVKASDGSWDININPV